MAGRECHNLGVSEPDALLPEIERICRAAGDLAIAERERLHTELKPDGSIVTNADRAVEEYVRSELSKLCPGDAVWGEESEFEPAKNGRLWVLDPVDGTSNFTFGQPIWGVSLALIDDDKLAAGCIHLPDLDKCYLGAAGRGATVNGTPMKPIPPGDILRHELVGYGDCSLPYRHKLPGKVRHIGSFVVEAAQFVDRELRAVITNGVRLYDAAAGVLLARELGAEIKELNGKDWNEAEWMKPERCRSFGFFPPNSNFPFGPF